MIIHNVENDSEINFPVENSITDEMTIEAKGRKGVVKLDAGNSWIQFTNPNDETIQIWHKKPKNSTEEREDCFYGIKTDIGEEPENAIELKEGDYLWTSVAYYDKAGHLIHNPDSDGNHGKYKVCYKLPVSDSTINVRNLNTLVGGINSETGEITTEAFEGTNIVEKVINNEDNISDHENKIDNLETIYSKNSDKLFDGKEEEKENLPSGNNFPICFGSVAKLLTAWNSFINNDDNDYIKKYLGNGDNGFTDYYSVTGMGVYQIKNISSLICLIIGTIKALKQHLENTINIAQGDVNSAKDLANTAMDALGEYGDDGKSVFNAKRTIADAFGRDDKNELCYFNSENTVRSFIEALDNKIDEKENNFNNYQETIYTKDAVNDLLSKKANVETLNNYYTKTEIYSQSEINELLEEKVDNDILNSYYNKADIDQKIGSTEDEPSKESTIYAYIKSLKDEIESLKIRVEALENPTPLDEGGENNGNDESGVEPIIPEDGE